MSHANKTTSVPEAFSGNFAKILRNVAILALEAVILAREREDFNRELARSSWQCCRSCQECPCSSLELHESV